MIPKLFSNEGLKVSTRNKSRIGPLTSLYSKNQAIENSKIYDVEEKVLGWDTFHQLRVTRLYESTSERIR